jgi:hypothetical protein
MIRAQDMTAANAGAQHTEQQNQLAMFPVAPCIAAPALATLTAAGFVQGEASRGLSFPSRYLRSNRS